MKEPIKNCIGTSGAPEEVNRLQTPWPDCRPINISMNGASGLY